MAQVTQVIRCARCQASLQEPVSTPPAARPCCPACGATARIVDTVARDGITVHDAVKTLARHGPTGCRFHESFAGEDRWRAGGKWVQKRRVIDRDSDYYFEGVTDAETGSVIHRCEEPLSKHRGHGSAKQEDDA